jgi:tetratricopeptide (TPR) repeat protein
MNGAETTRQVEHLLNPFCYYLRGLGNASIYQYELANNDFEIAQRKGKSDLASPRLITYAEHHRENIAKRVNTMLVSCSYFQGVSYKNLGKYLESRNKFQEALDRDPKHRQSRTYILQIMFFDQSVPFEKIEKEYETTIEEFQKSLEASTSADRGKFKKDLNVLKINQGNMYLEKLIPLDSRSGYKQYENQTTALKCYWEAYDYTDNDLAAFSVAQAMERLGASTWRSVTPQDLYKKAMDTLKKRVAEDHDQLYSVMLYYMLAICTRKLGQVGEASEAYLAQARHSLRQVPSYVTCFSPINKVRKLCFEQ